MGSLRKISEKFTDSISDLKDINLSNSKSFLKKGAGALLLMSVTSGAFAGQDLNTSDIAEAGKSFDNATSYSIDNEIDLYKGSLELESLIDGMTNEYGSDNVFTDNVIDVFRDKYDYEPSDGLDSLEYKIDNKNDLVESITEYVELKNIIINGEKLAPNIKESLVSAKNSAVMDIATDLVGENYTDIKDLNNQVTKKMKQNISYLDSAMDNPQVKGFVEDTKIKNASGDYPQKNAEKILLKELKTEIDKIPYADASEKYDEIKNSKKVRNAPKQKMTFLE